jgi:DNA-binding ferritin-like protein
VGNARRERSRPRRRANGKRIVDALNTDLAGTFILFNQLRKHYWTAGSGFDEITAFLPEAADRLKETSDEPGDPATAKILRRRLAELEGDLDAADKFLSDDSLVRLDG